MATIRYRVNGLYFTVTASNRSQRMVQEVLVPQEEEVLNG
jgi:hypothetical protein